ncbi:hypothetical protein [Allorhizocola rhizosphaerae]|uniref:hypothetical protein n=1 Tax=Allorhizocola rhizosphaerae TaxID=1872709 RepID=UPI000E3EB3C1|nr:hypothetical protein [Allorhizocola rhizosphaerae]
MTDNRLALCIGLCSFDGWRALPFAHDRSDELAAQLTQLGYRCSVLSPEFPLSADVLGEMVRATIAEVGPDGILIVQVLSHGHITPSGTLHVIGGDGEYHEFTDVERWLKNVVDAPGRAPLTLFLLDICSAGNAARLSWQSHIDDEANRAWVIAACAPDEAAYSGRMTQAAANVLRDLADGRLDIDRSLRHVPLTTVAQKIRREVGRLAAVAQAIPQEVTASRIDISSEPLDLPFFPNPWYMENPRRLVRPQVDAGVTPFLDDLDEALDPQHFLHRALGRQGSTGDMSGCFSGRSRELKILAPWLNLQDEVGLRVVTGSPGVGKSALIGVLVCAAHPLLRKPTATVWEHIEQAPYVNHRMAAVHARGRTVAEISSSIARQLGLEGSLPEAIAGLPAPPVIVVDALDEATNPVATMNELLIPLVRIRYGDEPLRLLVGMRPWDEFAPLRDLASDGVLDLDRVPPDRLRRDVEQYVSRLLTSDHRWDSLDTIGAAHTLARAVAQELTSSPSEWGAFLVAGLYTHHILNVYPEPIHDQAEAARLGRRVPQTLPEVLELDLSTRGDKPWLRLVLTALAYARGEGMPASLIRHAAEVPSVESILSALDDVRFYLRHSTESDGTTLYRLFHQGLTDHLRQQASSEQVYDRLLNSLRPKPGDPLHWHLAEPYLLRHALDHAPDPDGLLADPGFLIEADPSLLRSRLGPLLLAAYDAGDPSNRRQGLAVAASLHGLQGLADALADLPGQPPLPTIPLWTGQPFTAINTYTADGTSWVVLSGQSGEVYFRQLRPATEAQVLYTGDASPVTAVAANQDWLAVARENGVFVIDRHGAVGRRERRIVAAPVKKLEIGELGGRAVLMVDNHRIFDFATDSWLTFSRQLKPIRPEPPVPFPAAIDQICTTPFGETVIRSGSTVIALVTSG